MTTISSESLRGRLLDGRYRVESRIARGGMATVYTGVDTRLDRTVAIKVMHEGLGGDDDFAARFVREARAAARLSSPHVVAVFDQGSDDGAVFLVMEYVPGSTLRDHIRDNAPLPPQRALLLLEQVLTALAAAHQAGLVHRDVKPENVLIATDGRIKVADFGLARAISSTTAATATGGLLIGTVSYLAPELVLNQGADARCDIYACGVLLYEMLTGRKPHEGESPIQVAYKHVHEDVPPPSALMPTTPPYVDALVARATARDRDQRPTDAKVMLHQVRRVRSAVEAGLADDVELTEDLTPRLATVPYDTVPEEPLLLPPPPQLRPQIHPEHTLVVGSDHEREHAVPVGVPTQPAADGGATSRRPHASARNRRRGWLLIALVVAFAVAAAVAGWYVGVGRFTTTPDVTGATRQQAQTVIEQAGLTFEVAEADYSTQVAEGRIITTSPAPDDRVAQGGTVSVVLSKGEELYAMPRVVTLTEQEARAALTQAHLEPEVVERYSGRTKEGVVLDSSVPVGRELSPDTAVTLFVSSGPRPVEIPETTGESYEQVRQDLLDLGLRVPTPDRVYDDGVAKGEVISQSPGGGTGHRGDTVELVVSKGPHLVEVPNVQALTPGTAQETLEAAGFEVRVLQDDSYIGGFLVVGADPSAGTQAPVGSTVTIYVV